MSLQTQKAKAPEALQVMEKTLLRFLQEGPTEKELKAAKQNLIGGFALRLDTNRKLLDNLARSTSMTCHSTIWTLGLKKSPVSPARIFVAQ